MQNISLTSLRMFFQLQSPLVSGALGSAFSFSAMADLKFHRSFAPLFYTAKLQRRLNLKNSEFYACLSPIVLVESILLHDSSYLSTMIVNNELTLTIQHCFFLKVSSVQYKGGALSIESADECHSASITDTGFYNCRSALNGGALYIKSSSISLASVCFSSCFSDSDCMSAQISASTLNSSVSLNKTSIHRCAEVSNLGRSLAISIENAYPADIFNTNSSFNTVSQIFAGFSLFNTRCLDIHFIDVSSCQSYYIFQLCLCNKSSDFMEANFYNNSARSGAIIHATFASVCLTYSCFSQNDATAVFELMNSANISFMDSCFDCDLPASVEKTSNCVINKKGVATRDHMIINTKLCWDLNVYSEESDLWWRLSSYSRTAILSAGAATIVVVALFGRRIFQCRTPRLKMRDSDLAPMKSESSSAFVFKAGGIDADANYEVI